ncbi:DENN domain-containing protein 1A-like isoform X3 [Anopheles albimanus]|uniref:UDENN domain-containing protein n=1 Tax=Anopheles albimanus TaxID=7167 RepID=A0A8W7JB56_ANOAL|nr:DENN domain-containing protein 1A-like isoform X3 [Anopheles albimanus]
MNSRIKEDVSRLFEFWCEIAPGKPDDPSAPGYIVESFPESFKDAKVIADIPAFAYPCAFESRTIQVHSFVLTNIDSKWRFGFCRHDPKSPTAMVIVTYLPWHDTFMRFLNVLADIKKNRPDEFGAFLAESYGKGVPEPGACLKLSYDRPVQTFSFQRPQQFQLPSIPENHNLNQYYNFVEPKFMIGIFAAMLAERRIIFVSRRLDILSSCVQAANAFLYPMVWQHIFIPVLPMQMVDILGAPMPFLIGVPEAVYETLRREEIGDVVILNCDKRTLETPFDDVKSMPPELVASLKKQLSNPADHRGDRVSKIFLGILVQLIGGYRDAVKFNDKITFDPETFIESRPSHLRAFLSNMLQLQIFQQFIEERLDMLNTGQGFSDEFEVEYFRYAEKSGRKVKQYKDLLKNFKDKTNPAVRSAVKSVKEGGKGVKTAYKGLRSKFRETTPPKTKLDSHSSMHLHHGYDVGGHHQSAPNSPVFNKRPQTIALADDVYHTHHPHQTLTPSSTSLYNSPHIMMGSQHHQLGRSVPQSNGGAAGSSSMSSGYHTVTGGAGGGSSTSSHMNNNLSYGNGGSNTSTTINNNTSTTLASSSASDIRSPTLSPTSSNSSSEMNLWQEMQHHLTLFKSPAVNRNSQNGDTPDFLSCTGEGNTGGTATPPPNEDSLDLITLDTTNSSFELEDFDPLNERAKPIATAAATTHATATGTALTNSNTLSYHQHSVGGLPIAAGATVPTASFPSTSLGVNNPVYPYFTPLYQQNVSPHHPQPHRSQPPPFSSSLGAQGDAARAGAGTAGGGSATTGSSSSTSDDFELLRNYGLDKFALLDLGDGGKQTALLHMNGTGTDDILRKSIPSSSTNGRSSVSSSSNGSRTSGNKLSTSIEGIVPSSRPPAPPPAGYNGHPKPAFSNWTTFD